jgi:hypothetical protein
MTVDLTMMGIIAAIYALTGPRIATTFLHRQTPVQIRRPPRRWMKRKGRVISYMVFFLVVIPFTMGTAQAVTISDRSGGAIYWGGKYVNIKPSRYTDSIGSRSKVDQMEVTMDNDIVTVRITGPYFFNYTHKLKRTQDAPPGDLYISSQGWKVSGNPPYTGDIFEASEGWDYVVSFENKKVYRLNFSDITMTSALPYVGKYRAHQAWRGGYGEFVDDAEVILTDKDLTFIFSVRNMRLRSDIGVHWTMKCGNDIIEGSALIPPIAMVPPSVDPAPIDMVNADPIDVSAAESALPDSAPIPAAASQDVPATGALPGAAGGSGLGAAPLFAAPMLAALGVPGSSSDVILPVVPGNSPAGPSAITTSTPSPTPYIYPDTPVAEPSTVFLLLAGLFAMLTAKQFFTGVLRQAARDKAVRINTTNTR